MVHNPNLSQAVMTWCVETAINLVYNALENGSQRITGRSLSSFIHEGAKALGISAKDASRMAYELKRNNLVEVSEGDSVRLTNRAKVKIIDKISESRQWDGFYRVISFDIPEKKRSKRDSFRRAIKRMGFVQVQKSLWVGKRNVGDLIDLAAEEYGVSDYVAYFTADKSNINFHLQSVLQ